MVISEGRTTEVGGMGGWSYHDREGSKVLSWEKWDTVLLNVLNQCWVNTVSKCDDGGSEYKVVSTMIITKPSFTDFALT